MDSLSFLDWSVLAVYAGFVVAIGIYSGRQEKNTEDYFLGGRKMPWWAVMISIYATSLSALTFVGVPGAAYQGDFNYLQLGLGDFVGRVLICFLLLTAYYRGRVTTVYQLLEQRFGPRSRDAGTGFFLITRLLASSVRLAGCAIALSVVFQLPLKVAICLIALTALLYTMVGGIKAVIWTDMMQFILFMAAAAIALATIVSSLPNGWSDLWAVGNAHDKFQVFHISFAKGHEDYWLDFGNEKSFVAGLLFGCLGTFAALGTDQDLVQRMLTCEKVKDSQQALLLTAILNFPITLLFLGVGASLFVYYRYNPDPQVLWYATHGDVDKVFPHFIKTVLAPGLRGLLIAGLLAAAMSSLDSALNALASTAYVDIYQRYFTTTHDDATAVRISRFFVVAFAIILAGLAMLFAQYRDAILWLGFRVAGYTYGALLGIFLLAVLSKKRGNDLFNVAAMASSVFVVAILTTDVYLPIGDLLQSHLSWPWVMAFNCKLSHFSWPWAIAIGSTWTFTIGMLLPTRD